MIATTTTTATATTTTTTTSTSATKTLSGRTAFDSVAQSGNMSADDVEMANASDMENRVPKETEEKDDSDSVEKPKGVEIDKRVWAVRLMVDKVINRFLPMKDYIEKNGRRFNERPLGR